MNVLARRGVHVEDAVFAVGGLAGEVVARAALVELDVQGLKQHVLDGIVGVPDEHIDRVGVGGAVARIETSSRKSSGVLGRWRCRPVPTRRGAFRAGRLRGSVTSSPSRAAASVQPFCDTGTDDQHIRRNRVVRHGQL